ncbi:hypothetical protein N7532_007036 [Penicillium argentinense]|uniref:Uncharacterized protein n=1 Tax=Penicillium argentinense TaxID=1131581 RepID=A0A9W9KBC6_9EURO|nr:uncharacterized protein N7532_007036 [Penicillium argentinense]KAJ5100035.1 hypothetical protein N7532_007036 [Penicillium argentinense]
MSTPSLWNQRSLDRAYKETPCGSDRQRSKPPTTNIVLAQIPLPRPQPQIRALPAEKPGNLTFTPESDCIAAYFTYFHPLVSMLDESGFRDTYAAGIRKDDGWLALLNIVCALGGIAATDTQNKSHCVYYSQCQHHLGLTSLGSSHLETIKTLGLMGGLYLHYISQSNLAYSLMGAAQRMALAEGDVIWTKKQKRHENSASDQTADLVVSVLHGHGGMWAAVPSRHRRDKPSSATIYMVSLGHENVRFCQIATKIQEALAITSIIPATERKSLDRELQDWFGDLPPILQGHQPCSESIYIARTFTRLANRRIPSIALQEDERFSIEQCRILTKETNRDFAAISRVNQVIGWNGVWLLFQAVSVPLLGCFLSDQSMADPQAAMES